LLVAACGSRIVGWCRTFPQADTEGSASLGIGLLADFRDQGTGTRLINQSLEWAQQVELSEVSLTTRSDNERAIHVFQCCGFETADDCNGTLEMRVQL
jgi:RimJ/RimL family protein N-acetyltransferase